MLTDPQHAGGSGLGFETWERRVATVPILFQIKLRVAGGHGPDTLPNQTEGATGPSHLGTGTERNSIPYFMRNPQCAQPGRIDPR
jgi:hypothetical protein